MRASVTPESRGRQTMLVAVEDASPPKRWKLRRRQSQAPALEVPVVDSAIQAYLTVLRVECHWGLDFASWTASDPGWGPFRPRGTGS